MVLMVVIAPGVVFSKSSEGVEDKQAIGNLGAPVEKMQLEARAHIEVQRMIDAWADGFHRVMFWAGLLAVFSLVQLLRLRLPRVQAAPAAAVELH